MTNINRICETLEERLVLFYTNSRQLVQLPTFIYLIDEITEIIRILVPYLLGLTLCHTCAILVGIPLASSQPATYLSGRNAIWSSRFICLERNICPCSRVLNFINVPCCVCPGEIVYSTYKRSPHGVQFCTHL